MFRHPRRANYSMLIDGTAMTHPAVSLSMNRFCDRVRTQNQPKALALLPFRFEENNRYRSRQIQAARSFHRDRDATQRIRCQEILRQTFGLAPEYQKIAPMKLYVITGTRRFCCEKEIARFRRLRSLELVERVP